MVKVQIFRMAGDPITVEVKAGATVKDVFSRPGTGVIFSIDAEPRDNLIAVLRNQGRDVEALGSLRVNGEAATLATKIRNGSSIMIVPSVKGGIN